MLVQPLIGQPAVEQRIGQHIGRQSARINGLGIIGHRRFSVARLQSFVGFCRELGFRRGGSGPGRSGTGGKNHGEDGGE